MQKELQNVRGKIRTEESSGGAKGLIVGLKNQEESLLNQIALQEEALSLVERLKTAQGAVAEDLRARLVAVNTELFLLKENVDATTDPKKSVFKRYKEEVDDLRLSTDQLIKKLRGARESRIFDPSADNSATGAIELPGVATSLGITEEQLAKIAEANRLVREYREEYERFSKFLSGGELLEALNTYELELERFRENVTAILIEGLANTITVAFETLGESITNSAVTLADVGQAVLQSIGGFLGDLGKQFIAFGVAALFFDELKEKLATGVLAKPSAVGLIGAGIALTAISGAIKGTARRGQGGSGGGASAGQNVAPQAGLTGGGVGGFGDFSLTSSIRGTDLVLLIDRTKAGNT